MSKLTELVSSYIDNQSELYFQDLESSISRKNFTESHIDSNICINIGDMMTIKGVGDTKIQLHINKTVYELLYDERSQSYIGNSRIGTIKYKLTLDRVKISVGNLKEYGFLALSFHSNEKGKVNHDGTIHPLE